MDAIRIPMNMAVIKSTLIVITATTKVIVKFVISSFSNFLEMTIRRKILTVPLSINVKPTTKIIPAITDMGILPTKVLKVIMITKIMN